MSERLKDLPENALTRAVIDARQASRELKGSKQFVSGANLAYFTSQTPELYDWTGQLSGSVPTPSYGRARFEITLASSRAAIPLTDLIVTVYYSTDGVSWEEYTYRRGLTELYLGGGPEIWRTLTPIAGFQYGAGEVKYSLDLFGKLNTRTAFKLQAVGTDEVTISTVRVY